MIAEPLEQTRSEWLAERRTYLGASEMAAVLNVNPHASAHEVWLIKRGLFEVPESIAMRRGLAMEPFIASEYELATSIKPEMSRLYRNADFPFMACNPDREVVVNGRRGLLELKDVAFWPGRQWGTDGADQVPEHYLMQCMMQLTITKLDFVQLCACIDGRDIRIYTYTFDPEMFEKCHVFDKDTARSAFTYCVQWWNRHVVGGVEPPMSGLQTDSDWLGSQRATYDNGLLTNTDKDTDKLCIELEKLMRDTKVAELKEAEAKNKIKMFMVERKAEALDSTAGVFTYKIDKRGVASFRTPFRSSKA